MYPDTPRLMTARRLAFAALSPWLLTTYAYAQTPPTPAASAAPAVKTAAKPTTKADKSMGVAVTVTPEMTGTGMVSSGVTLPAIAPATGNRKKPVPSWGKPLPYPIVIADRRNNRLIEVAPDKSIVWEFPSPSLAVYRGNEDVNFSADGSQLAVSEEDNFDVHIVDYQQRALTWTYAVSYTHLDVYKRQPLGQRC